MPQSLDNVLLHIVFSTKGREPCLPAPLREALAAYLATVARNEGCECYRAGGTANHFHLAIRLARTVTVSALVSALKISSTKWIKAHSTANSNFAWQRGYGAFSLASSHREKLVLYIDGQESHHRLRTFEDEYRRLLVDHGVAFNEQYVWD